MKRLALAFVAVAALAACDPPTAEQRDFLENYYKRAPSR